MKNDHTSKMHVSLNVTDLQSTKEFYNVFFDKTPDKEKGDYIKYELQEPPLVISFLENKAKVNPEIGHFGFRVPDAADVQKKHNAIIEEVDILKTETATTCCYAVQDKFWVADPSGYKWEVYYFHSDADDSGFSKNEEACCEPMIDVQDKNRVCCEPASNCC